MATFSNKVSKELNFLMPIFREAAKANEIFHQKWKEGIKGSSVSQYKATDVYETTLSDFRSTQSRIEEVVRQIIEELNRGDESGLEKAFAYLKIKERHHRSGYNKEEICRKIKHFELNEEQKELLQEILIDQIESSGREFNELMKLIPKIKAKLFMQRIKIYDTQNNPYIQKRLKKIQDYLK